MCAECEQDKMLLTNEVISPATFAWGWTPVSNITLADASTYTLGVFIDRGYLRLVDVDDCQCLEAGQRIKINFCPFCGNKLGALYEK